MFKSQNRRVFVEKLLSSFDQIVEILEIIEIKFQNVFRISHSILKFSYIFTFINVEIFEFFRES